jgi:transposase
MITGKMSDQLRLPWYLWTWQAMLALVKREYGIELSLTTVGRYLKSWGITAQ